jgi:hypothetical protein
MGNPVDIKWLKTQLAIKTEAIDWKETAEDVRAFVMPLEQHSLNLWSREYFMHKIEQITTS